MFVVLRESVTSQALMNEGATTAVLRRRMQQLRGLVIWSKKEILEGHQEHLDT